jgi:hypothetical protein
MIIISFSCALTSQLLTLFWQMLKYVLVLWLLLDLLSFKFLTKECLECLAVEDTHRMGMNHEDEEN